MSKVLTASRGVLKEYPALSAALVNVGVVLLSYFGLHITADQLVYIVGLSAALLGVVVHSNVSPLAKAGKVVELVAQRGGYPAGPQLVSQLSPPPSSVAATEVKPAVVPAEVPAPVATNPNEG